MFAHDRGWLRRMREAVAIGPHRGGRGRAGADRQPRPHAAPDRPLSARAPARPRRPRQPPAAPARRAATWSADARRAARERHPRRPLHGAGRAARLRPLAPARPRAGGGRADEPRRHRRAGARHPGRRRGRERRRRSSSTGDAIIVDGGAGEVQIRPQRRRRGRLCREGAPPRPPAGAVPQAARRAGRHQGRRARSACTSMPACSSTCRICTRRAPTASACSAPSCSS